MIYSTFLKYNISFYIYENMPKMRCIPPRKIARYAKRKCHWTEIFVFPFFLSSAIIPVIKNKIKTTIPKYTTNGIPPIR